MTSDVQILYRPVPVQYGKRFPLVRRGGEYHSKEYLFWKEQLSRCRHGWIAPNGVFINPMYYFYLNFVLIKFEDRDTGKTKTEQPLYFKKDHEYFDEIYFGAGSGLKNPATGQIAVKGRRKHWTQNNMSGICLWFFIFEREMNIALVVPDEDTFSATFNDNFMYSLKMLPLHFFHDAVIEKDKTTNKKRPVFFPLKLSGDNREIGYQILDRETGQKITKNRFLIYVLIETTKKKSNLGDQLRGAKFRFVFCDEIGKKNFEHLKKFYEVAKHTVRQDDLIFGQIVLGGTSDALHINLDDYQDMFFNAKRYGLKSWFISACDMYASATDMTTGETDMDIANEKLDQLEALARQSGDKKELYRHWQENPRNPKQAFLIKDGGEEHLEEINEMTSYIYDNKLNTDGYLKVGNFKENINLFTGQSEIIFEETSKGFWTFIRDINPEPNYRGLDFMVVDDVYKDIAPHSTSNCCAWLCRSVHQNIKTSDMVLGYFYGRPPRSKFHEQLKYAAIYFRLDNHTVLFEDNDDAGFQYFEKTGYGHLIQYVNERRGIVFKEAQRDRAKTLASLWFESGAYRRLYFMFAWKELMKEASVNSDMRSCYYLWLLNREIFEKRIIRVVEKYVPKQVTRKKVVDKGFDKSKYPHLRRAQI